MAVQNRIKIQNITYPELDIYVREREAQLKFRPAHQPGIFIAESPIVIERALDAGYEPISLLMEDAHFDKQGRKIIERCGDIPVYTAPFEVLTQITGLSAHARYVVCHVPRRIAVCRGSLSTGETDRCA